MRVQNGTYTDDALLAALQRKDKQADDAIRHLYQEHFDYLKQYIITNNGTEDDAADIFQEVIIAFINLVDAHKFRGEASVKTFLYAMNRNLWLNELKRRGRALARADKFETMKAENEQNIQQGLEYNQSAKALMAVLEELGETCKKILLQFYYENRSMKEIVATLQYENEQVVRNKKSKCMKNLSQMLQSKPHLYQQLKTLLHG